MSFKSRSELALRIHNLVYANTNTFEADNIGSALAYLMGAMLSDRKVDICIPPTQDNHIGPLWILLNKYLSNDDEAFNYFNRIEMIGNVIVNDSIEN